MLSIGLWIVLYQSSQFWMLVSLCWWQIVRLNSLHTVYRVAMSRGPILKVSTWHLAVEIGPWTTKQSQLVVSVKGESSPGRVVCNSGNSTHLSSDTVIVIAAFFFLLFSKNSYPNKCYFWHEHLQRFPRTDPLLSMNRFRRRRQTFWAETTFAAIAD